VISLYKASLGLVGVAGIALLIGWLQQNNPATWLAIAASIAAALLLFALTFLANTAAELIRAVIRLRV